MYRCKLEELRKEKGFSNKKWSEESGVSIDTITRIIHPENPDKDSPRVNTLEDLCSALGVELWEIFYMGDKSLVTLQVEISNLKAERDDLVAEKAVLRDKIDTLKEKVDSLTEELLSVYKKYFAIIKPTE
jgi:DNA-binding Xre family transcriptional regulator